jgi:NADPH-dependent ferric siderophore reductase
LSDTEPTPRPLRRPRILRAVEVRGVTQVTPLVTRMTLAGPQLAGIASRAPAERRIRAHLLHERGLGSASLYTRGYWQVGEANHPDHDYGEDVT